MSLHVSDEIKLSHLPLEIRNYKKYSRTGMIDQIDKKEDLISLEKLEKQYIHEVLQYTDNNKTKAAKILGIHTTSLFRKIKSWEK